MSKNYFSLPGPFGQWQHRIGRVYEIEAYACAPTVEVWVKAAWAGLPTLLITPIKPSATDYLILRLGKRHGRPKRRFSFDVWDHDQGPRVATKGIQNWVFRGLSLGTRALWYMTVADAVTGFALTWTSAAYQFAGCKFPGEAYCQTYSPEYYLVGPISGGVLNQWIVQDQFIFAGGGPTIISPDGYRPSVGCQMNLAPNGFPGVPQGNPTFTIKDNVTGTVYSESTTTYRQDGTASVVLHNNGNFGGDALHSFTVDVEMGAGVCKVEKSYFSAYGASKRDNILPDP